MGPPTKEVSEVLSRALSFTYQRLWLTKDFPVDWRFTNVTPIYKKAWKEDLVNH